MNDADVERLRREEFPLAAEWAYLNHAGTGPLPVCHVLAAEACLRAMATAPPRTTLAETEEALAAVRGLSARLLRCSEDEIAVLSSTVQALNLVPLALAWRPGDEVIAPARDYPSVLMSLDRLRPFGVVVRHLPDHEGRFALEDLEAAMTDRTRLVALSMVGFATGWRAPVAAVANLCRARGIWLVVDAIQAVGALDVDAPSTGADLLAAHGYKHLLAGYGVAPTFVSPRGRALLPPTPSRMGVKDHLDATRMIDAAAEWSDTARRFESAVPSLSGLVGMAESLKLLLTAGPAETERRVFALLDRAAAGFGRLGWRVTSPLQQAERSSLLCVAPPAGIDADKAARELRAAGIVASAREGGLRLSPHVYNTHGDIDRLLDRCGRM